MKGLVSRIGWVLLVLGMGLSALALGLKAWRPGEIGQVELAPGESVQLGEDVLVLKDFRVVRYPSGRIRQFDSDVHVVEPAAAKATHATIRVNEPLRWKGQWLYQMSYDAETERITVLEVRRDPWLPVAALAGALLLLGSFALAFVPPRADDVPAVRHRLPRLTMAFAVTLVPLYIIGRAVLRPEPIPALQSPLMAPHVAAYAASYLIMLFAAFGIGRRWMPLGFFLMTAGLVLGAVWGKICWGDYWQYDPKEMWGLVTWLAYFLYFAVGGRPRLRTAFRILGVVLILLTATVANYSRIFSGLHSYVSSAKSPS